MKNTLTLLPLALLFATGVALAQKKAAPLPDLVKTQATALMHNKRVLVVISEDGDDYTKQLKRNRAISRKLSYEFEIIAFGVDRAAKKWQWKSEGSGVIALDAEGKELGRFVADELTGKQALVQLEPLFCKPVDADNKLQMALANAKKTGRNILIRFDAPW